jgi:hypothetical protein
MRTAATCIALKRPKPCLQRRFWTAKSQFYADCGPRTDVRCSLREFLQPARDGTVQKGIGGCPAGGVLFVILKGNTGGH